MSGGWEREEWRSALFAATDAERWRLADTERQALGVCGDADDDLYGMATESEDD